MSVAALATCSGLYASEGWAALSVRYLLWDDAFCYLKLAETLRNSGSSSFDGVHPSGDTMSDIGVCCLIGPLVRLSCGGEIEAAVVVSGR
jgi:hypothetical protein